MTARFGFADVDHATSWLGETLADCWARRIDRCDRLVISVTNLLVWLVLDGQKVIAKCSVDLASLSRLAEGDALVAWLHSEGIPVAARDIRLRIEREDFSLGLYPFVDGDLLDVADASHVEAAGRMLATLHEALATYPLPFDDGQAKPNQHLTSSSIPPPGWVRQPIAVTKAQADPLSARFITDLRTRGVRVPGDVARQLASDTLADRRRGGD